MVSVCVWKRVRRSPVYTLRFAAGLLWLPSGDRMPRHGQETWGCVPQAAMQRQDFRTARPDFGAFERVIVEENEAIQSKVELLSSDLMFSLWPPVDPPGHEVILLQDHVRAFLEYLKHIELVVLTAQTE